MVKIAPIGNGFLYCNSAAFNKYTIVLYNYSNEMYYCLFHDIDT